MPSHLKDIQAINMHVGFDCAKQAVWYIDRFSVQLSELYLLCDTAQANPEDLEHVPRAVSCADDLIHHSWAQPRFPCSLVASHVLG